MIDFQNGSILKLRKVDNSAAKDAAELFVSGEEVVGCYKNIRDYVVFTNKRVISVNTQGVTGKKKDFTSIPYSKVQVFSVETSGFFDMDSDLELYISGVGVVHFEFTGGSDIIEISRYIASYAL